ncbi:MAG: hypothetical protein K2O58_01895, partial [Bacteroidales bacterium]|nr:hypothetical protein [Bacteroidales bacterium]
MKKRVDIFISAVLALTSCGTAAQFSSTESRFQDGIYAKTSKAAVKTAIQAPETGTQEIDELIAQTKSSEIYLLGDEPKTIVIPESQSATLKFENNTGATVTIQDSPDFTIYFDNTPSVFVSTYWDPWYSRGYWGYYDPWYGPWRYSSWYYSPWRYDPWYWGYGSFGPWHYGPWHHDPWHYYGHYAWHSPWHHHHIPSRPGPIYGGGR